MAFAMVPRERLTDLTQPRAAASAGNPAAWFFYAMIDKLLPRVDLDEAVELLLDIMRMEENKTWEEFWKTFVIDNPRCDIACALRCVHENWKRTGFTMTIDESLFGEVGDHSEVPDGHPAMH